jgi:hypothetical protein
VAKERKGKKTTFEEVPFSLPYSDNTLIPYLIALYKGTGQYLLCVGSGQKVLSQGGERGWQGTWYGEHGRKEKNKRKKALRNK